jgi:hypothetical protein
MASLVAEPAVRTQGTGAFGEVSTYQIFVVFLVVFWSSWSLILCDTGRAVSRNGNSPSHFFGGVAFEFRVYADRVVDHEVHKDTCALKVRQTPVVHSEACQDTDGLNSTMIW